MIVSVYPKRLLFGNKVAKIGDTVILKSDVEDFLKLNDMSFEEAENHLIEKEVFFIAGKSFLDAPDEEAINESIKNDKAFYASMVGEDYRKLTDEDFLNGLYGGTVTVKMYKKEVIKRIYVSNYLDKIYADAKIVKYYPTATEINEYVKAHEKDFIKQAYIMLSLIYFSYYDNTGRLLDKDSIKVKDQMAEDCLSKIKNDENFSVLVEKYSDDVISKNSDPLGNVGRLVLKKEILLKKFSAEISEEFMSKRVGVIKKLFKTKNGSYIFNIRERYREEELPKDIKEMKAKDLLERDYMRKVEKDVRLQEFEALKKKFDVIIY